MVKLSLKKAQETKLKQDHNRLLLLLHESLKTDKLEIWQRTSKPFGFLGH